MALEARYREQVRLLIALLPFVDAEPCFVLKGGTAVQWKLANIGKMQSDKHRQSVALLEQSLDALLHRKPM